jgi:hypothetical protein
MNELKPCVHAWLTFRCVQSSEGERFAKGRNNKVMKTLTSLLIGGALLIGPALAQDSKSPAKPAAAPTAQGAASTSAAPTKSVKKHKKHNKTTKPAASSTAKPAVPPATPAK